MNNSHKGWGHVRQAVRTAVHGWIYDPNVMLIDYGWRERGGKLYENEPCIRVHVVKKFKSELALESAIQQGITRGPIPDLISGIRVDRPQGSYRLHPWWWNVSWQRPDEPRARNINPMLGGISISNAYQYGYGTLGGLVTDRETGKPMILSNWHVLAGRWHARAGWPICQPGRGDGGTGADMVAKLSRHGMAANIDAAVAELTGSRRLVNDQFGLDLVKGVVWAQMGMEVIKSGRTTAITYGRVTGVDGTIRIPYDGVYRLIRNVMTIEPRHGPQVSAGGDSGSFWLEEKSMSAVGLHFAGSDHPERALAMDMHSVLDALKVDIIP